MQAARRSRPRHRFAATAEASVQPVPCASSCSRAWRIGCTPSPSASRSTTSSREASAGRWPPFSSTARAPSSRSASIAPCIASTLPIARPSSSSASGMFGVTIVASGSRRVRSASSASASSRRAPVVATMTGSSTTCAGDAASSASATASITSRVGEHAQLHRADGEVIEAGVDLRAQEAGVGHVHRGHAARVLGGERGDRATGRARDARRRS